MSQGRDDDFEGARRMRVSFPAGLRQPAGSMRFALDSLLLPCFVAASLRGKPVRVKNPLREQAFDLLLPGLLACADLGCGCGSSALALLSLVRNVKIWGIDKSDDLVASARQNASALGFARQTRFETMDVAALASMRRPCCDLVQINPPYWEEGHGLASAHALNNSARRSSGGLTDFLAAARQLLVFHGRLFVIFPAVRVAALLGEMPQYGFGVRRLQAVRPFAGAKAGRVLVEAWRSAAHETVWEPDLVLYSGSEQGRSRPTKGAQQFCPWLR